MVKKEQTKPNSSSWEVSSHLVDYALKINGEYEDTLFLYRDYPGKF